MRHYLALLPVFALLASASGHATAPNADTQRWWTHIQALANDGMEGRDTGSEGHRKAVAYVVRQLEAAGVTPAGEAGYLQHVPVHALRLRPDASTIRLTRNGRSQSLRWLRNMTVTPATMLPSAVQGELIFAGSDNASGLETAGRIVVRLSPTRLVAGAPAVPAPPAGAAAVIGIDSAAGPEPARWPAQYAVTMTLAGTAIPVVSGPPVFRFNPASADVLFEGTGHTYQELLALSAAGQNVPSFALGASLAVTMQFAAPQLVSDNVLGVVRGSDPALADEYVVLSAHLDGYGIGEPLGPDRIYNGAFDDAAYVATLLDLVERLKTSKTRLRRSLLLAVVTGEEKGLLGSRYYTQHPTVPKERMVANINLDQLRPVFPLHTLTTLAVDESTMGDTVREVARSMDIEIQPDPEPLRNLLRRSDHFSFMGIGVPAVGFIFGYKPGTSDEVAYRKWYADRYHTPLDDLGQPWVPEAAAKFNTFFGRLVEALANAETRPRWKPESAFAPKTEP